MNRTIHFLASCGLAAACLAGCGLAVVLVAGCADSFDIDSLHEEAKLSVSCFPSQSDTTWIEVTHTIPVAKGARKAYYQDFLEVEGARIDYKVNGQQRFVGWKEGKRSQWGEKQQANRYYVVGAHQPGDHVEIRVEADGYHPVQAETRVPYPQTIDLERVIFTSVYDAVEEITREVYQLTATFSDPAETADYYALRLRCRHIFERHDAEGKSFSPVQLDTVYNSPRILTSSEPLLQLVTSLDNDFGYSGDFYQDFSVFTDRTFNGQTYTLHLDMRDYNKFAFDEYLPIEYQVRLYRITPEFYSYVKSINDIDNNELAQGGFSMLSPTYTNVSGGVGVLGGYYMTESQWRAAGFALINN